MKTIYKYPIEPKTVTYLDLPKGSQILSTQEQRGSVNIYALVDTGVSELETHEVLMYGTGHRITERVDEYQFLGTVSMAYGDLVFHLFHQKVEV